MARFCQTTRKYAQNLILHENSRMRFCSSSKSHVEYNELIRQFININLLEMKRLGTFTKALGTDKAKLLTTGLEIPSTACRFDFIIPPKICLKVPGEPDKNQAFLPVSAAMAILDDLSAYGMIAKDKQRRPGVSVYMSTQMLKRICPGQRVECWFQVDKVGKSIGFCTMKLLDPETHECLAQGDHIKYMPMGWAYENIIGAKNALPYIISFYHRFGDFTRRYLHKPSKGKVAFEPEDESLGAIYRGLMVDGSDFHAIEGMNNPVATCHGGAIAMAIEQSLSSPTSSIVMNKLSINYLSAMKVCKIALCFPIFIYLIDITFVYRDILKFLHFLRHYKVAVSAMDMCISQKIRI